MTFIIKVRKIFILFFFFIKINKKLALKYLEINKGAESFRIMIYVIEEK